MAKPFISVILLAAGESSRMGEPKQTLSWEGTTLLQYQVSQVAGTTAGEVIVVLGYNAKEFSELLPAVLAGPILKVVVNRNYQEGKTTSVKAGLANVDSRSRAVMVLAMDSPRTSNILQRLIDCHGEGKAPVTMPYHRGREGHPPTISRALFPEIRDISEEKRGLREVIERDPRRVRLVEFGTPLVLINLNSPQDYKRALGLVSTAH